jgi:hypothetical protein
MGLFAKWKAPDASGLSKFDRLNLVGASLRDDPEAYASTLTALQGQQKLMLAQQQQAAKLKAQGDLAGMFGGAQPSTAPIAPIGNFPGAAPPPQPAAAMPSISDPATIRKLIQLGAGGANIAPVVEMLKANVPDIAFDPSNVGYDRHDQGVKGRVAPGVDKGQFIAWEGGVPHLRNVEGATDAAGAMAGAVAGAQESAKAALDVIPVNMPDGSTHQIPRDVAAQLLRQQAQGGAGGFGQSQSPAAQAQAVETAKAGVQREVAQPQMFAGLQDQSRATDVALQTINEILGQDPTGRQIGNSMVSPLAAGFGANLGGIKGTPAYNLEQKLAPLKAIIGFNELQKMRANSPTGGALGQVSERENSLLQSLYGSLDPGQDPKQFVSSLRAVRDQLREVKKQREQLYGAQYGGQRAQPHQPAAPRTTGPRGSRIISVE